MASIAFGVGPLTTSIFEVGNKNNLITLQHKQSVLSSKRRSIESCKKSSTKNSEQDVEILASSLLHLKSKKKPNQDIIKVE